MIKFKQTAATPEPRPTTAAIRASSTAPLPAAAEASAAPSGETSRAKRRPAATASKDSETQLSVAFDESSPDKG